MDPTPVGVNGDLSVDRGAGAAGAAFLPSHLGMSLGGLLADLLGDSSTQKGGESGDRGDHLGGSVPLDRQDDVFDDGEGWEDKKRSWKHYGLDRDLYTVINHSVPLGSKTSEVIMGCVHQV